MHRQQPCCDMFTHNRDPSAISSEIDFRKLRKWPSCYNWFTHKSTSFPATYYVLQNICKITFILALVYLKSNIYVSTYPTLHVCSRHNSWRNRYTDICSPVIFAGVDIRSPVDLPSGHSFTHTIYCLMSFVPRLSN